MCKKREITIEQRANDEDDDGNDYDGTGIERMW